MSCSTSDVAGYVTVRFVSKPNENRAPTKHGARWHHTSVGKVVQRRDWYLERLGAS